MLPAGLDNASTSPRVDSLEAYLDIHANELDPMAMIMKFRLDEEREAASRVNETEDDEEDKDTRTKGRKRTNKHL